MLSKFAGQDESDSVKTQSVYEKRVKLQVDLRGLDLSGGNCGLLVVRGELGCLGGDTLEDVWE